MASVFSSERAFGRIFAPDEAWLARGRSEAALDPRLPIIDAHHHLWDLPGHRYLLPEFAKDIGANHNVRATVFVSTYAGDEAARAIDEVKFAADIAATSERGGHGPCRVAAGIVGFADLAGDRVAATLEAEIEAGGGRFRGIRQPASWDGDPTIGNNVETPSLYGSDAFRHGMRSLAAMDLSFDALVFHPQLGDITQLARAFPQTQIVLNHMGTPLGYGSYAGRGAEVFAQWRAAMAELARCANVTVKLGGVMIRLAAIDYLTRDQPPSSSELAQAWLPWVETCIALFGVERCMVESNFPVEKIGIDYSTLWNTFQRLTDSASAGEKAALFSGTAERIYKLAIR